MPKRGVVSAPQALCYIPLETPACYTPLILLIGEPGYTAVFIGSGFSKELQLAFCTCNRVCKLLGSIDQLQYLENLPFFVHNDPYLEGPHIQPLGNCDP